jgi:hypothetical protein
VAAKDDLLKMGFDMTLQRKWIFHFTICDARFALRVLNNLQIVLKGRGKDTSIDSITYERRK